MTSEKTLILSAEQMDKKIVRMAWEIYENNYAEKSIILGGIAERGYLLAQQLEKILKGICQLDIICIKVSLEKEKPWNSKPIFEPDVQKLDQTPFILVDDVLNTGSTLLYAIAPLLKYPLKKVGVAVLINRSHKKFPIVSDVTGLRLSTSSHEHVQVELNGKEKGVYLH